MSTDTNEGAPFDTTDPTPVPAKRKPSATALAIKEVNAVQASYERAEKQIAVLAEKYRALVVDVSTPKGLAEAKAIRAEIREVRYNVQNAEAAAKVPLNTLKAHVSSSAKALREQVLVIETPWDELITAEEERRTQEKAAREMAEAEAKRRVDDAITGIRETPLVCLGQSSADIRVVLESLRKETCSIEDFGDRAGEAQQTLENVIEKLEGMAAAAEALEQQRRDMEAQAEALRMQQEADAERARLAREEEARRFTAEREQLARDQEAFRVQQEALAKQRRELEEAQAAERRQKEEAARAERKRVEDAERAERERQENEERIRREAAEAVQAAERRAKQEAEEAAAAADKRLRDAAPVMLAALQAFNMKEEWIVGAQGPDMVLRIPMAVIQQAAAAVALATQGIEGVSSNV